MRDGDDDSVAFGQGIGSKTACLISLLHTLALRKVISTRS